MADPAEAPRSALLHQTESTNSIPDAQSTPPRLGTASSILLRVPSTHTLSPSKREEPSSTNISVPSFDWLAGSWHVAYTTLPMWNGKQNVRITYKKLEGQTPSEAKPMPDLDDLVEYQKVGATKVSSVRGVSRPVNVDGAEHGLAYSWRGKGWLKIASSNWEILGWGKEEARADHPEDDWVVTYFSKTMFTPAGIDIYCRSNRPLSDMTLKAIKDALASLKEPSLVDLAKSIFEVPRTEIKG